MASTSAKPLVPTARPAMGVVPGQRKIKVLIVDDSAVVRKILNESIGREPDMEVVGLAPDPFVARDQLLALEPDVITLDIEMPRMDGLTFLTKVMQYRPTPVIIISSVCQSTCDIAVEAMRRGAVDVLAKPSGPYSVGEIGKTLPDKVRAASLARVRVRAATGGPGESAVTPRGGSGGSLKPASTASTPSPARPAGTVHGHASQSQTPYPPGSLIAIGASTGGTQAIEAMLTTMPADSPAMVITQHMPPVFSSSFAARLHSLCRMEVKEAQDGDIVAPGRALIAPGDYHLMVKRVDGVLRAVVRQGPRVHYQRPAVDVLFQSVAELQLRNTVGVLLTGMGSDGAQGMLRLRESGAFTIAQDEATCVVFGMPKVAIEAGAAMSVLPIDRISGAVLSHLAGRVSAKSTPA
jgi:two-component system, chemotaxis family, protein-glutamate methylesterase/glutaminase